MRIQEMDKNKNRKSTSDHLLQIIRSIPSEEVEALMDMSEKESQNEKETSENN